MMDTRINELASHDESMSLWAEQMSSSRTARMVVVSRRQSTREAISTMRFTSKARTQRNR